MVEVAPEVLGKGQVDPAHFLGGQIVELDVAFFSPGAAVEDVDAVGEVPVALPECLDHTGHTRGTQPSTIDPTFLDPQPHFLELARTSDTQFSQILG